MSDFTLERLEGFLAARPVRPHVQMIRVVEDYPGAVAYFDSGLVISEGTWEEVKRAATIHSADIGNVLFFEGVPVEMIDSDHPDHRRLLTAWSCGLFAKVNDAGIPQ